MGVVATGTITNGRLHSDLNPTLGYAFTDPSNSLYHTAFTDKPDSVVGWYKCNPAAGDFGTVKFLLHTGAVELPGDETNYIAYAYYELPGTEVTQWTRFSTPFDYTSNATPEFVLSILTSGNGTEAIDGSTAQFDDIQFIYNPSAITDLTIEKLNVYVHNNNLVIKAIGNISNALKFTLSDISGRTVYSNTLNFQENNNVDISSLENGLYIATAIGSDRLYTGKILITK